MADVLQRVCVQKDDVGKLAGRDGAEVFLLLSALALWIVAAWRAAAGGNAGLDEQLQLLMQREARRDLRLGRVGPCLDQHTGAIQFSGQLLKLGELTAAILERARLGGSRIV